VLSNTENLSGSAARPCRSGIGSEARRTSRRGTGADNKDPYKINRFGEEKLKIILNLLGVSHCVLDAEMEARPAKQTECTESTESVN